MNGCHGYPAGSTGDIVVLIDKIECTYLPDALALMALMDGSVPDISSRTYMTSSCILHCGCSAIYSCTYLFPHAHSRAHGQLPAQMKSAPLLVCLACGQATQPASVHQVFPRMNQQPCSYV